MKNKRIVCCGRDENSKEIVCSERTGCTEMCAYSESIVYGRRREKVKRIACGGTNATAKRMCLEEGVRKAKEHLPLHTMLLLFALIPLHTMLLIFTLLMPHTIRLLQAQLSIQTTHYLLSLQHTQYLCFLHSFRYTNAFIIRSSSGTHHPLSCHTPSTTDNDFA